MLYFVEGNIFESPAQTLVNTVNTVGAMGKGLALHFKQLFPDMFKQYQELCEKGELAIGRPWLYRTDHKWILNFPTKQHWRNPARLEYIETGLQAFERSYDRARINSIAFPQLGCGNGELDWTAVKPLMQRYLEDIPIDIYIYESVKIVQPEHTDIREMRMWLRTEPTSYPFAEFVSDLKRMIDSAPGLVDVGGGKFTLGTDENGLEISGADQSTFVPWQGDEVAAGWLQLWQYLRTKGICTETQVSQMGFAFPSIIVKLLLKLPYVRRLALRSGPDMFAAQLYRPTGSSQLPLFEADRHKSIVI